jgi:hypothetical protein
VVDTYYSGFTPVSALLSIAGSGWHIDNGVHYLHLILGGVFDRFPKLQIIVGHHLEILSWATCGRITDFRQFRVGRNRPSMSTCGRTSAMESLLVST